MLSLNYHLTQVMSSTCRPRLSLQRLLSQLLQTPHSLIDLIHWQKQMVMVEPSDRIRRDPLPRQPLRNHLQKSHGLEARVHIQRHHSAFKCVLVLIWREILVCGAGVEDQSGAFLFMEEHLNFGDGHFLNRFFEGGMGDGEEDEGL